MTPSCAKTYGYAKRLGAAPHSRWYRDRPLHIKKTVIINLGTPHRRRPTPHLRRRALTRRSSCGTSTRRARGRVSTRVCLCHRSAGFPCPQLCELRTWSLRVASATRVAVCVCCQMTRPSWCVRACKLYLGLCIGTPIFKGKMVFGTSGPVSVKGRYAAAERLKAGAAKFINYHMTFRHLLEFRHSTAPVVARSAHNSQHLRSSRASLAPARGEGERRAALEFVL